MLPLGVIFVENSPPSLDEESPSPLRFFGNRNKGIDTMTKTVPNIAYPNHQAPRNRGSLGVIAASTIINLMLNMVTKSQSNFKTKDIIIRRIEPYGLHGVVTC